MLTFVVNYAPDFDILSSTPWWPIKTVFALNWFPQAKEDLINQSICRHYRVVGMTLYVHVFQCIFLAKHIKSMVS